ncbi:MAG: hypothetical protein PHY11_04885 [Bacilli bacterium]|nr:hypothetical protein [Bacilli bacterium]MDD4066291.1 hypothetical protein [Bacilli bacterium]
MNIILSRKGFDSGAGGIPSPILPDGTLLSLPIPSDDKDLYESLMYEGKSYLEIIKELKQSFSLLHCHVDPDIRKIEGKNIKDWVPAFGQAGAALTHFLNHNVGVGDIFLFYGWFRQTEYSKDGKLQYIKGAPDLQIIYGYLQVGEMLTDYNDIKKYYWHPHADIKRKDSNLNALFLPNEHLLDTNKPGYGTFMYNDNLVLTKKGHCRSHWNLPKCLEGKEISYHDKSNYKDGYFQSAMRGQEFVVKCDKEVIDWIKGLF